MKLRKVALFATLLVVISLSLSSCKRSGYGCPMEMKISSPIIKLF